MPRVSPRTMKRVPSVARVMGGGAGGAAPVAPRAWRASSSAAACGVMHPRSFSAAIVLVVTQTHLPPPRGRAANPAARRSLRAA